MSTVGAFAAYGPLGGFGFPTQGPKNRVASGASGETRPGAGPQRVDGSQLTAGGVPEPSRESETEISRPVLAADASEKNRLESGLTGANPEEKAIASAGIASEEEKEAYDPSVSAEELTERIEAQVQRFEEFLERLNEYAKLRDAKRENVEEVELDVYGRAQANPESSRFGSISPTEGGDRNSASELDSLPELDIVL